MGFRELIKQVQQISGFSDSESKDALEHLVESLSVHLTEGERQDFASQLPPELQDIALSVYPTDHNSKQDMIEQFMENMYVDKEHAKKQILSAWRALKDAISEGEIEHIRAQLPNNTVSFLH
jgi:uncharacterized protein (DUF2267 family)